MVKSERFWWRMNSELGFVISEAKKRYGLDNLFHVPEFSCFSVDFPFSESGFIVDYAAEKIIINDLRASDDAYSLMRFYNRNGFNYDLYFCA